VIYTSAKQGYSFLKLDEMTAAQENPSMEPLMDFILENVPDAPQNEGKPFRMQVANLGYDNFVGRLGIGRIADGSVKVAQEVIVYGNDGSKRK